MIKQLTELDLYSGDWFTYLEPPYGPYMFIYDSKSGLSTRVNILNGITQQVDLRCDVKVKLLNHLKPYPTWV